MSSVPCPHSKSVAVQLADPAARLDTELASHLPGCEACRRAAARAVREWPTDRSPSPSLAEWLREGVSRETVLSPYQAAKVAGGEAGALELGPYLLLDRLGAGGMGEVYRARHRLLQRADAVKTLRPELAENAGAVKRFLREAEAVAKLHHPNVVHVYTADRAGAGYYLAMEYVPGTDLGRFARATGPLPIPLACELVRQAAEGLQHAFARGLVHRDIKPANLLLRVATGAETEGSGRYDLAALRPADLVVKVADFGLARAFAPTFAPTDGASEVTGAGAVLGTTDYMAPEQAENARAADTRADVYSLGCTLYYLLVGAVPFPGGNAFEKMARHALAPVPSPAASRPDVPPALDAVVRKCLAKRPDERYQTPAELAAALRPFARAPEPVPAPVAALELPDPEPPEEDTESWAAVPPLRVAPATRSEQRRPKRNWVWVWAGAALLALAVASAGAVYFVRDPKPAGQAKAEPPKPDPKPGPNKVPAVGSQQPGEGPKPNPNPPTTPPGTGTVPTPKGAPPWVLLGACASSRRDKVRAVGFAPDGSVLAGREGLNEKGTDTGFWERWAPDARDRPRLSKRPAGTAAYEFPVHAGPGGLVTQHFQRFDPLTFDPLPALVTDLGKYGGGKAASIDAAAASLGGKYLVGGVASGGKRYAVQWKAETGAIQTGWEVTTAHDIPAIDTNATGDTVAVGTAEGKALALRTGAREDEWAAPGVDPVTAVAVAPDGKTVYSAHASKTVFAWKPGAAQPRAALDLSGPAFRLAVSPDGRWLVAVGDGVAAWDLHANPAEKFVLDAGVGDRKSVAFSADGTRFVVGGWAGTSAADGAGIVWVWELKR